MGFVPWVQADATTDPIERNYISRERADACQFCRRLQRARRDYVTMESWIIRFPIHAFGSKPQSSLCIDSSITPKHESMRIPKDI